MSKSSVPPLPLTVLPGVLLVLAGMALQGTLLDRDISLWANQQLGTPSMSQAWLLLSWSALGGTGMVLLTLLSVREPQRVGAMLLALLAGGVLVHLLKNHFEGHRPALVLKGVENFQHIGEYLQLGTMPSGHATLAMALAFLMTRTQHPSQPLPVWVHLWWVFGALQAFSRVVVGAHWTSDILVGGGLALALTPFIWRSGVALWLGDRFDRPMARRILALLLILMGVEAALAVQADLPRLAIQIGVVAVALLGALAWWLSARLPMSRRLGATWLR